jgi:hypothetical protein
VPTPSSTTSPPAASASSTWNEMSSTTLALHGS